MPLRTDLVGGVGAGQEAAQLRSKGLCLFRWRPLRPASIIQLLLDPVPITQPLKALVSLSTSLNPINQPAVWKPDLQMSLTKGH